MPVFLWNSETSRRGLSACGLTALLCSILGCGSPSAPAPAAAPAPARVLSTGSDLSARDFAMSPDYEASINYGPSYSRTKAKPAEASSGSIKPVMNHWFYLINGSGIPEGTDQAYTAFTPNVMRVNGTAPQGAPNPNGGTGVSAQPFAPAKLGTSSPANAIPFDGSQLWRAIAGPNGTYYLRSAQSFEVNTNVAAQPSLLVGNGASAAALDLGNLPNWNTSIYWNQRYSPTGDESKFQQWTYDRTTAQLTNVGAGKQLDNAGDPTLTLDTNAVAPSSQWYPFPSYSIEQVLKQPAEAFPDFSTSEESVYEWMSTQIAPGVSFYACAAYSGGGVRCLYDNINVTGPISSCISETNTWLDYGIPPAALKQGFSEADFDAVAGQLNTECSDVTEVEASFTNYQTILSDVFINASDSLPGLASDVGASESDAMNPVPLEIIEGVVYAAMSTLNPGMGLAANLIAAGTTTAISVNANNSAQLTSALKTTVGTLYTDMATQFLTVNAGLAAAETSILGDWGKLNTIGPLTLKTGYNGLGMTPDEPAAITKQLATAYKLTVMQQLMPITNYVIFYQPAIQGNGGLLSNIDSWNQYNYPTFGNEPGNNNYFWMGVEVGSNVPDQTVMQTDIQENGANMFDFFNGINGWKNQAMSARDNCTDIAVIFNATPNDLHVKVDPVQGYLAVPGQYFDGGAGSTSTATYELRPYGYLPIFSTAQNKNYRMDVNIYDDSYSSSNTVGAFAMIQDGCGKEYHVDSTATTTADKYQFTSFQDTLNSSLWTTIYRNN